MLAAALGIFGKAYASAELSSGIAREPPCLNHSSLNHNFPPVGLILRENIDKSSVRIFFLCFYKSLESENADTIKPKVSARMIVLPSLSEVFCWTTFQFGNHTNYNNNESVKSQRHRSWTTHMQDTHMN